MASVRSLDNAYGYTGYGPGAAEIPQQGRIMRNLIEGGDLVMSHILHFYHLAALDYISTGYAGCPISGVAPWSPKDNTPDMVGDPNGPLSGATALATTLITHYVQALNVRRQAHQMIALASGKQPCQPSFTPGGVTNVVTNAMTAAFSSLLTVVRNFIDNTYLPDVSIVAGAFGSALLTGPASGGLGAGCMKYLAYGTFPNSANTNLLNSGFLDLTGGWPGTLTAFNVNNIQEHITYSFYDNGGGAYDKLHPSVGVTSPKVGKAGAYSWLKAPRYCTNPAAPTSANTHVCEVGPLARVFVAVASGNTAVTTALLNWKAATPAISALTTTATLNAMRSVLGRHAARAVECKVVADAMVGWLTELGGPTTTTGQTYRWRRTPKQATGYGLTEAPRGALGHWVGIKGKKISHYQCVVPTTWNACPKDDFNQPGPIEQAIVGTNVSNTPEGRTRVGRIVRSFDPCIACAVHIVSPDKKTVTKFELPTQ